MPRHITEYILYRWRYTIAYCLVGLMVSGLLVAALFYVPGGLRGAEINETVQSSALSFTNFDPMAVIDLPYSLLQRASFMLFGISTISIKLPSLLLALASLVGIIFLLRQWFHMNVAVISAVIVITTSQFIFASQDGTPIIMYIFMPVWLLFFALKVSRQEKKRRIWEALLILTAALSLYTPLSIYVIIALTSATLLHPHLRYIVGRISRRRLLAAGILGLIVLAPLITAILANPNIGLTLLGIPNGLPDIIQTSRELIHTHLGFMLPGSENQAQPVYMLPSLLLMLLGSIHLIRTRHTARSYIIISWLVLLTPIIILNPSRTIITFTPVMLLIAAGIDELLGRWYSMFPRNPYARIAGLFPLALLVVGMALTGTERYFYSYRYTPPIAARFSDDLDLLNVEVSPADSIATDLVVTKSEQAFYEAVARRNRTIQVITSDQELPTTGNFIVTREAFYERNIADIEPAKIITNGKRDKSDRLYLYKVDAE